MAVLRLLPGRQRYIDCGRAYFEGEGRLECAMTLRAGRVVWDPHGTLHALLGGGPRALLDGAQPATLRSQAPQRCACTRAAICPMWLSPARSSRRRSASTTSTYGPAG